MKSSWRVCLYVLGSSVIVAGILSSYMKYPGLFWNKTSAVPSIYPVFNISTNLTLREINQSRYLHHFISNRTVPLTWNTTVHTSTSLAAAVHKLVITTPKIVTTTKQLTPTSKQVTTTPEKTKPTKTKDGRFYLYTGHLPPDVTVVTAYFNLGTFRKGGSKTFNTALYMKWAAVYTYIRNPLVLYTDSQDLADKMRKWRVGFESITKILVIDRKSLWAFDYMDKITKIYADPKYPKHHPNTVVPAYSCAQHAKYALVDQSIKDNYFKTTYFTWIDLGYFRDVLGRNNAFVIQKPPNFNESRVAMNRVYNVNMKTAVSSIFRGNYVWIGGGMFFGNKNTLPLFIEDYKLAVEHYLNMNLSSTDQQVIFSMYTDSERDVVRKRVPIQVYFYDGAWFGLGYDCYRELKP